ncbi:homogentisate 1,2-dioxygenase [Sphingomonas lenta]|uniref:Homogentisate 1,2-dioxygenase n=1 Tax=Sphingomonas lenta TaxID=1141887 RepID=A0A2A2SHB7_9SPHN|nr:homogentisate 1,2-dioxygenase [Sphingomonas lenta]PAX08646.1 homogentisate 1,2-dioxygenase [Sphingomonas lenta]
MLATLIALAAAQAQPACPVTPAPLPAELAGWRSGEAAIAGAEVKEAEVLTLGRGARAALHPSAHVAFPVRPAKPGPGAHGGLLAFDAARAGRYRVALETPGWIEVVRDGRAVPSVSHAHGPACSGVRKMVDFDLEPGRHLLEIAGAPNASVTVLVTYLP